jgi:aminopeptidase N
MKAFANAPEVSATLAAGGMVKHQFAPIGPMPTYLAALAVGEFDVAEGVIPPNDVRKVPLPHRTIATKGQAGRMGTTMAETPKILARLEQYFGIPYPWAKLDQIASPIHGGAMENNGLIVYDDTLLLLNADAPPSQLRNFGIVVAHELAHQWFGNGVTPRWWDDIWLNESFAEWMGNKIAADWRPDLGIGTDQLSGALGAMDGDSLAQGRPIRQPITDSAEINAAFDSITYQKGGQTIRMMSSFVGDDAWQKGVRLHLGRNWHGTATADEFFANIAEGAQDPRLVPAFRSFVDQQGVPLVTYTTAGGGAKGGVAVDPRSLSQGELERVTRKLVGAFHRMMGPVKVRRGERGERKVGRWVGGLRAVCIYWGIYIIYMYRRIYQDIYRDIYRL